MGKEPDRLAGRDSSPKDLGQLEREIAQSRKRLSDVVAELDRRRHDLLSLRAHPLRTAALAASAATLIAVVAGLAARGRARERRVRRRAGGLAQALRRAASHPERAASGEKSPLSRIAVAILPIVVKRIADYALERRRGR